MAIKKSEEEKIVNEEKSNNARFIEKIRLPKYDYHHAFWRTCLWLGLLLFLLDLLSKWLVVWNLGSVDANGVISGTSIAVIPNFFYIHLVFNEGMAFGLGDGSFLARIIFIIISLIASILIFYFWLRILPRRDVFLNVIFALCWSGAFGNLLDRAFYWENVVGFSGVVDFFEFYLFGHENPPFAVFNVADACLTVGLLLAIVYLIIHIVKDAKEKRG